MQTWVKVDCGGMFGWEVIAYWDWGLISGGEFGSSGGEDSLMEEK